MKQQFNKNGRSAPKKYSRLCIFKAGNIMINVKLMFAFIAMHRKERLLENFLFIVHGKKNPLNNFSICTSCTADLLGSYIIYRG